MTESQLPWSSSEGLNQKQVMNHHSLIFTLPSAQLGSVNSLASAVWVPSEFSVCLAFCSSRDEISSPLPPAQKGLSVNPPPSWVSLGYTSGAPNSRFPRCCLTWKQGKGCKCTRVRLGSIGRHPQSTEGNRAMGGHRGSLGGREPRLWLWLLEVMRSHYWFLRLGALFGSHCSAIILVATAVWRGKEEKSVIAEIRPQHVRKCCLRGLPQWGVSLPSLFPQHPWLMASLLPVACPFQSKQCHCHFMKTRCLGNEPCQHVSGTNFLLWTLSYFLCSFPCHLKG